jgi:tetratricopeptide (TPR) repeat protein
MYATSATLSILVRHGIDRTPYKRSAGLNFLWVIIGCLACVGLSLPSGCRRDDDGLRSSGEDNYGSPDQLAAIHANTIERDHEVPTSTSAAVLKERLESKLAQVEHRIIENPRNAQLYYERGIIRQDLRLFQPIQRKIELDELALRDFERAHELNSEKGHARALVAAGRIFLRQYAIDDTERYIRRAVNIDPTDIEVRVEAARIKAFKTDDWHGALDTILPIVRSDEGAQLPGVLTALGLTYAQLGMLTEAKDAFERVMERAPHRLDVWTNIGLIEQAMGNIEEARKCFDRALAVDQADLFAMNNLASSLTASNDIESSRRAETILREVLAIAPEFPAARNNLGNALSAQGRYQEAIEVYQSVIDLVPNFASAYYNLGIAFVNLQEFDDAIEAYRSALLYDPGSAKVLFNLGNAYQEAGRFNEAEQAYRKAVEANSSNPKYWNSLGFMLMDLGRLDEARNALERAVAIDPKHSKAHDNLGVIELRKNNYDGAIEKFHLAITLEPRSLNPLLNLLEAYVKKGDLAAGTRHVNELIEEFGEQPHYIRVRGTLLFHDGKPTPAIDDFNRAIALDPEFRFTYFLRAVAKLDAGEPCEARRYFEESILRSPPVLFFDLFAWVAHARCKDPDAVEFSFANGKESDKSNWPQPIAGYLSGRLTEESLLSQAADDVQRCQAYFFIAERVRREEGWSSAQRWYKKSIETGVVNYIEYVLAIHEFARYGQ